MKDNYIDGVVIGGVHGVPGVETEPEISLAEWQVVELPDGDRHFFGYHVEGREGRMSSSIQSFDSESRIGITKSGRTYKLQGGPGRHPNADYVANQWLTINGIDRESTKDATSEFYGKEE